MGSRDRDREQRDQMQEQIDTLTKMFNSATEQVDALRSECVERRIREEHLGKKLREADQKIERLQKLVNDTLSASGVQTRPLARRQ
jgi:hypothetical protein